MAFDRNLFKAGLHWAAADAPLPSVINPEQEAIRAAFELGPSGFVCSGCGAVIDGERPGERRFCQACITAAGTDADAYGDILDDWHARGITCAECGEIIDFDRISDPAKAPGHPVRCEACRGGPTVAERDVEGQQLLPFGE